MKPVVYTDIQGQIWKVMADGQWLKVQPSEIVDTSVPFVQNLVQALTNQPNTEEWLDQNSAEQQPAPQYSPNTNNSNQGQSGQGSSFVVRVQPTLDETIPQAGFETQDNLPLFSDSDTQGVEADSIPPLSNNAALTVTIEDGGDGYENQYEVPSVSLFGDAPEVEDGRIVVVTLTDTSGQQLVINALVNDNTWRYDGLDISSLAEGPISVYASVTDYFGQFVEASDATIKDVTAELDAMIDGQGDNYINQYEQATTLLRGEINDIENGQTVLVQISDVHDNRLNFTTRVNDGQWQIADSDLSSLHDGELIMNASSIDIAGNPTHASSSIIKDTQAQITATIEGNGDNYLNQAEVPSTRLFGEVINVEDGQAIDIVLTDSHGLQLSFETVVTNNAWQLANIELSQLAEGQITITATTLDKAGNIAASSSTITKDTLADISANFDGVGDNYINQAEVSNTRLFGEVANVEDGQTVLLTVTDSVGKYLDFSTTILNGQWQIADSDLSSLHDGELTISANSIDIAGNPTHASSSITKDTQANITATIEGNGDNFLNQAEVPSTRLFGEVINVEDGQAIDIVLTDSHGLQLSFQTVVTNNAWQLSDINLSSLQDGELRIIASTTDIAGNPTSAESTIIKDTLADISANFDGLGDNYINAIEAPTARLLGSVENVENDQTVDIVITDPNGMQLTLQSVVNNNAWQLSDINLSSLQDGELRIIASTTDIAGNPTSAESTIIKDTLADISANFDGLGDNYINAIEAPTARLFGSVENVENDQTVDIVITDPNGMQLTLQSVVNNNAWQLSDINLSSLQDGELRIIASTTDIAGNPTSAESTIIKDTLADISANFDGVGDSYINAIEAPAARLFGSVENVENDQTVDIVITDPNGMQLTLQSVVNNNAWQLSDINLSSLQDGELRIIASTTDIAGNPTSAESTIIKDTLADISANFDGVGDNYINAIEAPAARLFGSVENVENDQIVDIVITDPNGMQLTLQSVVNNNAWQLSDINLSSLQDGELRIIASTTDIAGNPTSAESTIIKDTLADISANFDGLGDNYINQAEVSNTRLFGEVANVEDGQTVLLTVTDSAGKHLDFSTTILNGQWQVNENLSELTDGTLQLNVQTVDIAGNPTNAISTIHLDTAIPTIDIDTLDGFSITQFKTGLLTSLQGTTTGVEQGQTVTIEINDGEQQVTANASVDENGDWLTSIIDIDGLNNLSAWTLSARVSDIAGNSVSDALPMLDEPDPHLLFETDLYQSGVLVSNSLINIFDAQQFHFADEQPELIGIESEGAAINLTMANDSRMIEGRTTDTGDVVFRFTILADNSVQTLIYRALDNDLNTDESFLTPIIAATQFDTDGTSETVLTPLVIALKDSIPQVINDSAEVTEGERVYGNLIDNDFSLDGSLKVSQVSVNGETKDVSIIPAVFETEHGRLVVDDSGYWLFTANRNLNHQQVQDFNFEYQVTDSSGDTANANGNIVITDGENGYFVDDLAVSAEASLDDAPNVYTETFTLKPGSDNPDPNSLQFSETSLVDLASLALTSSVHLNKLSYSLSDDGKTLTAEVPFVGVVFTLSLTGVANGDVVIGTTTLTMFDNINQWSSSDLTFLKLTILSSDLDGTPNQDGVIEWVISDGNNPQLSNNQAVVIDEAELSDGEIITTGSFELTIGSDSIDALYFDYQQTALSSGGESLSFAVSPTGYILTAYTDDVSDPVFMVEILDSFTGHESATLNYQVTLYKGVDQIDGEQFPITLNVRDTDNDTQSLDLNISINDSSDITVHVADMQLSESPKASSSPILALSRDTSTIQISANQDPIDQLYLDIVNGQAVIDSSGNTLSQNGQALSWRDNADGSYDALLTDNSVVFSVLLPEDIAIAANTSANLELQIELFSQLDHHSGNDSSLNIALPIKVSDTDGTSQTSVSMVTIYDGLDPSISTLGSMQADEDGLIGNNTADGVQSVDPIMAINTGSDDISDIQIDIDAFNALAITSNGSLVSLSNANNDGWYVANNLADQAVFQIKVNLDGTTEFQLFSPLDHSNADGENNLALLFSVTVIDADGDVSASSSVEVNVTDAVPISENRTLDLVEGESFTTQLLNETTSGSDGASIVSFDYNGVTYAIPNGSSVTLDLINPNLISEVYGELTISSNGQLNLSTEPDVTETPAIVDSISYIVEDFDGDQVTSTATLTLGDSPGVIRTEDVQTTEDNSVVLSIEVRPGDTDQNESVSAILIDETSLNGGSLWLGTEQLVASGGVITITNLAVSDSNASPNGVLRYQPQQHESLTTSSVNLAISSTINTDLGMRTINASIAVDVLPIADTPEWDGSSQFTYNFVEDDGNDHPLDITANLVDSADGSESLLYQFADLPSGLQVTINGNAINENKQYTQAQLDQVSVKADNNLAGKFVFSLIAIATEAGTVFANPSDQYAQTSQTITVNIQPAADLPHLSVNDVKGLEDQAIDLSTVIAGQLADTDGSETLSYKIVVDEGWSIVGGSSSLASPNTYLVLADEIESGLVSLVPKQDISSFTENLSITVSAIATESTIDGLVPSPVTAESAPQTLTIELAGVVDAPEVSDGGNGHWIFDPIDGVISNQSDFNEDQLLPLDFVISTSDNDISEEINLLITNIPSTITLVNHLGEPYPLEPVGKDPVTGGIFQISNDILSQIFIKTAEDFSGNLKFDVFAISTEPDGDSGEFEYSVNIEVKPVVDETDGNDLATQAIEDRSASVNLLQSLGSDADGSEAISAYTIESLPDGVTLFYDGSPIEVFSGGLDLTTLFDSSTTSWEEFLSSGRITLQADQDLSGNFTIPIRYQVTDTSPTGLIDLKTLTAELQVNVAAKVELDTRLSATSEPLTSVDGSAISLDGSVLFIEQDIDGSEYLDYIEIVIPDGAFFEVTHPNGVTMSADNNWIIPATGLTNDSTMETAADILAGATLYSALNVDSVIITVKARVLDGEDARFISAPLEIQVSGHTGDTGEPCSPSAPGNLSSSTIDANEGEDISVTGHLNGDISNDPGDVISFYIATDDLPEGVEIEGSGIYPDYNALGQINGYTISAEGIETMTLVGLDDDYAGQLAIPVTVVVTATCSGDSITEQQTITIAVQPIVDEVLFSAATNTILEDTTTNLDLAFVLGDSNIVGEGIETVTSLTLSAPENAQFIGDSSILIDNGNDTWTVLDPSRLNDIEFRPPNNFSGQLSIGITANIVDQADGMTDNQTKSTSVVINVQPVTDLVLVDAIDSTGDEDNYIQIDGLLAIAVDQDGSETIALSIQGVPEGAVLSYFNGSNYQLLENDGLDGGSFNGNPTYKWGLDSSQLSHVYLTPPLDFSGDIPLSFEAISIETGTSDFKVASQDFLVGVNPIGDDAQFFDVPEHINAIEGDAINIPVNISSFESNSDESILLTVKVNSSSDPSALVGLDRIAIDGQEAKFNAIAGSYTASLLITASSVASFELYAGDAFGHMDITLFSETKDSAYVLGSLQSDLGEAAVENLSIDISPLPDPPVVNLLYTQIISEQSGSIPLGISMDLINPASNEVGKLTISGIPSGLEISGQTITDGELVVNMADVANLAITGGYNASTDFTLTIDSFAKIDGDKANGTSQQLHISLVDPAEDTLAGGIQTNLIIGGAGDDFLSGGLNADTFAFRTEDQGSAANPALDIISDFDASENMDTIDLSSILNGLGVTDGASAQTYISLSEQSGSALLTIKPDSSNVTQNISLSGVSLDDLYKGDAELVSQSDLLQKMIDDQNLIVS
ncbi:T1SS-143 repeat domain-containing protein [Agarivorans sp. MS3-6]